MARILTSGFEAPFSPTEEGWERWAGTVNTEASSWQPTPYYLRRVRTNASQEGRVTRFLAGDRSCLCFDSNDNLTSAFKRNHAPVTEGYGRFAWRNGSAVRVANGRIFEWYLNGIGAICSLTERDLGINEFVGLNFVNNAGGVIQAYQTSLLGASTARWELFEWYIKLAGSGGRMKVWVNGVKWIDYFGPLAGPGGETTFDSVIIGQGGPSTGQAFNTSSRRYYDDIAINDVSGTTNNGRVGEGVIFRRVPRFPGSTTQLLSDLGGADPEINFRRVNRDDDPNGFVGAVAAGSKDSYLMSNEKQGHNNDGRGMPPHEGYAAAIVLQARGIQNGPSIGNIRYAVTPNGQAEFQTPAAPGLSLDNAGLLTVNHQLEVNPNTGEPFTHADLDGLEAGFSLEV